MIYILYILNGIGEGMVTEVNIENWSFCLLLRLENMKEVHLRHLCTPFNTSV